jgi:hypothetical protein
MPLLLSLLHSLQCAAIAALSGLGLAQSTWYIDASAPPPGNGTLASPFASIQYALDQPSTVAGDLLLAAPGEYVGNVRIEKGVTLRASSGPLATTVRASEPGEVVILDRDAKPTLEGFSILGDPLFATTGVRLLGGQLKRCIVRDHALSSIGRYGLGVDASLNPAGSVSQCTIVRNDGGVLGPGYAGTCKVVSSVVFANAGADLWLADPEFTLWNSGLGNSHGFGNLSGDALLWDLSVADVHLGPLSPCIDAGHPGLPPDPDGSPADMGAVPFDPLYLPPIATYCTGKVNSQGCAASIGASGGAGASMTSSSPFLVTCSGVVEGAIGLMFWGHEPRAVPFLGGFHCVEPPTPRTAAQHAGSTGVPCSGSYSFDFNGYAQSGSVPALAAGQVIRAQYWYRDPADPQGFFAATSNAIAFPLGP